MSHVRPPSLEVQPFRSWLWSTLGEGGGNVRVLSICTLHSARQRWILEREMDVASAESACWHRNTRAHALQDTQVHRTRRTLRQAQTCSPR